MNKNRINRRKNPRHFPQPPSVAPIYIVTAHFSVNIYSKSFQNDNNITLICPSIPVCCFYDDFNGFHVSISLGSWCSLKGHSIHFLFLFQFHIICSVYPLYWDMHAHIRGFQINREFELVVLLLPFHHHFRRPIPLGNSDDNNKNNNNGTNNNLIWSLNGAQAQTFCHGTTIIAAMYTTMAIIATTNLAHLHTCTQAYIHVRIRILCADIGRIYTHTAVRYITLHTNTIPKINQIGFKFMYSQFTGIKFYFGGISLKAKWSDIKYITGLSIVVVLGNGSSGDGVTAVSVVHSTAVASASIRSHTHTPNLFSEIKRQIHTHTPPNA